jgi:hypothetical protein
MGQDARWIELALGVAVLAGIAARLAPARLLPPGRLRWWLERAILAAVAVLIVLLLIARPRG